MMAISGDELNKIDILCPNKTRFLCSYFYCATDTNLNSFVSWVNGNYYVINLDHFGHLKRKIKLFKDQFLDEKMQFFNDEDYLYAIYSSKTGVNIYKFEINNLD